MEYWVLVSAVYLLVGGFAGLLAGLLGVGGGMVMVPALLWLLPFTGVPESLVMQSALGTSLGAIVMTSLASLWAHHKRGAVQWPIVRWMSPGVFLGAMLSGGIAASLASHTLMVVFALFAACIGWRIIFQRNISVVRTPAFWVWPVWGSGIGVISGLVGIGGGSLTVPLLLHFGKSVVHAVATSAAVGFPIAIGGTIGYIAAGWQVSLPEGNVGFVFLPAVFALTFASWLTVPYGVRLAHRWPAERLKKIFAIFLWVVSARLLVRALLNV